MSDRGSMAVELALLLPVIALLLVTLIETAGAARLHVQVSHAAREGARAAATIADHDTVIETVQRALGAGGTAARITVERTWIVGGPATVSIELPHRLFSRALGGVEVLVRGQATMRVER